MSPFMRVRKGSYLLSIAAGVTYGVAMRLALKIEIFGVMSLAFMFLVPLIIGFYTVLGLPREKLTKAKSLVFPLIPMTLGVIVAMFAHLEGLICVVMYLPVSWVLSSVGGLLAYFFIRYEPPQFVFVGIGVLPLLVAPIENTLPSPERQKVVASKIVINAPASRVWDEIKSVREIGKDEMKNSWVHQMGFPRPLSAEIDKEDVGGIRNAMFERGLVFRETVTQWEPEKVLAFTIDVDPKDIPPTALDEHVTIGGPYFDVLKGEYRLENNSDGTITLHLKSWFRLSTRFNWYADIWTELVMQRIQQDILGVVGQRAAEPG